MSKIRLFFLSVLFIGFFSTCENQSPIPMVPVNFTIYLNTPTFLPLTAPGSPVYIPYEGYKGIIVIQTSPDMFVAYDAACTYDPTHEWGRVQIEPSGIFAIDTVCGSQYSLMMNGMVNSGPAGLSLTQYAADYNPNMGSIHIHN